MSGRAQAVPAHAAAGTVYHERPVTARVDSAGVSDSLFLPEAQSLARACDAVQSGSDRLSVKSRVCSPLWVPSGGQPSRSAVNQTVEKRRHQANRPFKTELSGDDRKRLSLSHQPRPLPRQQLRPARGQTGRAIPGQEDHCATARGPRYSCRSRGAEAITAADWEQRRGEQNEGECEGR